MKAKNMSDFKSYFFMLILMVYLPTWGSRNFPENQPKLESILGGPVLQVSEAPALYALFNDKFGNGRLSILERLSEAQERFLAPNNLLVNQIRIVDSLAPRVFVHMQTEENHQTSRNEIYLTKGMIFLLLGVDPRDPQTRRSSPSREHFQKVLASMIIGVLAHEIAHPLDNVTSQSISRSHSQASQAIEVRADITGALIAGLAGFPREGGYEALSHIQRRSWQRGHGERQSLLQAYFSSHPVDDARKSALSSFLTFYTYEHGQNQIEDITSLMQNYDKVLEELFSNEARLRFWSSPQFESFEWALDHLEKLRVWNDRGDGFRALDDPNLWPEHRKFQLNHLLRFILEKISEGDHTEDRLLALFRRASALNSSIKPIIYRALDRGQMAAIQRKHGIENCENCMGVEEFLDIHPLFSGKSYYDLVMRILTQERIRLRNQSTPDSILPFVLPLKRLISEISPEGISAFADPSTSHKWNEEIWQTSKESSMSAAERNDRIIFRNLGIFQIPVSFYKIRERVKHSSWATMTDVQKVAMFFKALPLVHFGIGDYEGASISPKRTNYLKFLRQKANQGDASAHELVQFYDIFLRESLKYAGDIAVLEYMGLISVDWHHIAQALRMDLRYLGRHVNEEFVKVLRSPQRFEALKTIINSKSNMRSTLQPLTLFTVTNYADHRKNLIWVPPGTNYSILLHRLGVNTEMKPEVLLMVGEEVNTNPQRYVRTYEAKLRSLFNELLIPEDVTREQLYQIHLQADNFIFNTEVVSELRAADYDKVNRWNVHFTQSMMRGVMGSSLPIGVKRRILSMLFLENVTTSEQAGRGSSSLFKAFPWDWKQELAKYSVAEIQEILLHLKTLGLSGKSFLEFANHWRGANALGISEDIKARKESNSTYSRLLRGLAPLLRDEWRNNSPSMNDAEKKQSILNLVNLLVPPSLVPDGFERNSGLIAIQQIAADLVSGHQHLGFDNIEIFKKLTNAGPSIASDRFFESFVEDQITLSQTEEFLKKRQIARTSLSVELTRKVIHIERTELRENLVNTSRDRLYQFFSRIRELNPDPSSDRDKILEELAYEFQLSGRLLLGLVENHKSLNMMTPENVRLPQFASAAITLIQHLTRQTRWELMNYLAFPESTDFPPNFRAEIMQLPAEVIGRIVHLAEALIPQRAHDAREYLASKLQVEIEKYALNTRAIEKVPVIEGILTAGHNSLVRQPQFLDVMLNQYLRLAKGSTNDLLLRSFLSILPEHERAVTLSYMLATSTGGQTNSADLFMMGRTLGIKFGQASSIWNLFGEEVSRQTRELKDNAQAMSKAQVEALLGEIQRQRPDSIFSEVVSIDQVLGAASIKTVVMVTMKDGTNAVLAVRNPSIVNQIRTNLSRSRALIEALRRDGVYEGSDFFKLLIQGLEDQIYREIEFLHEARMMGLMQSAIVGMNQDLRSVLGEWSLDVVQPLKPDSVSENATLMQLARGQPFKKLSAQQKLQVGPMIVESVLHMFFKYGFFEPDRHTGNFFVDFENKIITHIDAGQLEVFPLSGTFAWDARVAVAEFLIGAKDRNSAKIIQAARFMAENPDAEIDEARLASKLDQVFLDHGDDISSLAQDMAKALAEGGLQMKSSFNFGIIKGLLILGGENYVSAGYFKEILGKKIRSLYLQKPLLGASHVPRIVGAWMRERLGLTSDGGGGGGRDSAAQEQVLGPMRCDSIL